MATGDGDGDDVVLVGGAGGDWAVETGDGVVGIGERTQRREERQRAEPWRWSRGGAASGRRAWGRASPRHRDSAAGRLTAGGVE